MNDQSKTKKVLIWELALLRQRIKEAERSESEYQQTGKKLREIEKQLLAIYELSSDVIYTLDCDFRPISISSSVERHLGYCAEELIGKPFNDLNIIAPESLEDAFKDALEVLSGGTVPAAEYVFIRKDGSRLIAEVSGSPLMEDGKIIGVISVARDITDRKQAEETQLESEERYHSLFNYAVDGIAVDNAETGELTDCNQALCRMVERDRTELIGQHQSILHPENHLENGISTSFRLHKTGDKVQVLEDRLVSKSGKIIPVEINATKIQIRGHDHLLGIFRDITERKLAEEAQRLERDRLEVILKTAQDGFWLVDASTGRLVDVNEAASSMLGYTRKELLARGLTDIDAQFSPEEIGREMQKIKTTGNAIFETRQRTKGGQIIDAEVSVNYLPATDQFFSFIRNITERKQVEKMLLSEKQLSDSTINSLPGIFYLFDDQGGFKRWNKNFEKVSKYSAEELSKMHPLDFFTGEDRELVEQAIQNVFTKGENIVEAEFASKDGRRTPYLLTGMRITIGNIEHLIGMGIDITDRKQAEENIRQMAYHDSLTGLPNRKLFSDRLGIALTQAQRNKKEIGIAMLDLDNFKDVNDTLGHDVGDLLLKEVAKRLSAALRKADTVARFGGDEFALILSDLKAIEDSIQLAQKIVDSFHKPFLIDTHQLVVTTSVGIAVYPNDGTDEGTLLKNADIAMYQAKQAGRDRYQLCKKT